MATSSLRLRALPRAGIRPGILPLLAAVAIWGGTYVVTKGLLDSVGPFSILVFRFGLAFLALLPFAYAQGYRPRLSLNRRFVLFGLTGMALHLGLENVALQLTTAGSAALIVAAVPAVTTAFAVPLLGERPSPRQLAGIAASIAGVVLISGAGWGEADWRQLLGNALVLSAVVSWAIFTIQGKRLANGYSALVATTAATGAAFLLLLPIAAVEVWATGAPAFNLPSALAVVYLGIGASAAAFLLWNKALHHLDASVAAPYINLIPVIGFALALLAGEKPTAGQMVGGAVVGLGVALASSRR
ncbi:MAG TPA: DMT family transporter [Dehalococcoidia bacterium]|nr:DMT family transporter [Dehalococcoidia bacterium]